MKAFIKLLSLTIALALSLGLCTYAVEYDSEEGVAVFAGKVINNEIKQAAAINPSDNLPAKSAVLMERSTGKILFAKNENDKVAPASITKIMSLLLIMQALDSGKIKIDDMVTTSEQAAGMGGSQIWLKVGEQMSVHDLIKATAVNSANDATYALGEYIAGSEGAFVDMMNAEAKRLGMNNTNFVCSAGLDSDGHYTSALDVAIMSRELLKYPKIKEYTTIWMDSLRNGKTELVNTNRLIRFYEGTTGLKTGTTSKAGSCLAASAERGGMELISVVMGSPDSNQRFAAARSLLDLGFANYMKYIPEAPTDQLEKVKVNKGVESYVEPSFGEIPSFVISKNSKENITQTVSMSPELEAPVEKGQTIGRVEVMCDGEKLGEYDVVAAREVEKMTFFKAVYFLLISIVKMK